MAVREYFSRMATQTTTAGFQAALAACADAVLAEDWVTAQKQLAVAELINAALDEAASVRGAGSVEIVKRRETLQKTAATVELLRQTITQRTGGSRIVTGRTNFSQGFGR